MYKHAQIYTIQTDVRSIVKACADLHNMDRRARAPRSNSKWGVTYSLMWFPNILRQSSLQRFGIIVLRNLVQKV